MADDRLDRPTPRSGDSAACEVLRPLLRRRKLWRRVRAQSVDVSGAHISQLPTLLHFQERLELCRMCQMALTCCRLHRRCVSWTRQTPTWSSAGCLHPSSPVDESLLVSIFLPLVVWMWHWVIVPFPTVHQQRFVITKSEMPSMLDAKCKNVVNPLREKLCIIRLHAM